MQQRFCCALFRLNAKAKIDTAQVLDSRVILQWYRRLAGVDSRE